LAVQVMSKDTNVSRETSDSVFCMGMVTLFYSVDRFRS